MDHFKLEEDLEYICKTLNRADDKTNAYELVRLVERLYRNIILEPSDIVWRTGRCKRGFAILDQISYDKQLSSLFPDGIRDTEEYDDREQLKQSCVQIVDVDLVIKHISEGNYVAAYANLYAALAVLCDITAKERETCDG